MKYFSINEFACKHCHRCYMSRDFMNKLDSLRSCYGKPIVITSGYRCPKYNNEVSSTGLNGPHTTGKAADILVSGKDAHKLLGLIMEMGFQGIGINQKGSGRFMHVDDIEGELRPWVWSY